MTKYWYDFRANEHVCYDGKTHFSFILRSGKWLMAIDDGDFNFTIL